MKKLFKTNDILLASFLLTRELILIDVIEDSPSRFVFLFSNLDKCNELRRKFLNNALAPAQELFSKREILIAEIKNKNSFKVSKVAKGSTVPGV